MRTILIYTEVPNTLINHRTSTMQFGITLIGISSLLVGMATWWVFKR